MNYCFLIEGQLFFYLFYFILLIQLSNIIIIIIIWLPVFFLSK